MLPPHPQLLPDVVEPQYSSKPLAERMVVLMLEHCEKVLTAWSTETETGEAPRESDG